MLDDINQIVARAKQAHADRMDKIAVLPCGPCGMGSATARACEFYGKAGCKHADEMTRILQRREDEQRRQANLLRAGLTHAQVNDPTVQLVLRDELKPTTAVRTVRRALSTPQIRFLVLGGPHRSGKTMALFLACALRTSSTYLRAQALGRLGENDRWCATQVLAINELGRENLGERQFAISQLDELMAEREYGNGRLTVFATQLAMPALVERYGSLFASRVQPPIGAYVKCADDLKG